MHEKLIVRSKLKHFTKLGYKSEKQYFYYLPCCV